MVGHPFATGGCIRSIGGPPSRVKPIHINEEESVSTKDNSEVIKHLEMVEAIVTRLAGNSFLLKGWSVTAGGVLLGLAVQTKNFNYMLLVLIPVAGFWLLD